MSNFKRGDWVHWQIENDLAEGFIVDIEEVARIQYPSGSTISGIRTNRLIPGKIKVGDTCLTCGHKEEDS